MKGVYKYSFLLGFLGLSGFKGLNGDPLDFLSFAFFGSFSCFWWYKLGDREDERLVYNKHRAGYISFRIGITLAVLSSIAISLFSLDVVSTYKMLILIIALTSAISMNLWGFLTYKFDLGA